ncbi:multiple chloroplast division site 1 [Forsythia ovata]|uniref:Multiple chloroplast division site 1 n=1 Tax=Forsythia ovata TaxID=205694 RepID=A0ABD1RM21_9LAMI
MTTMASIWTLYFHASSFPHRTLSREVQFQRYLGFACNCKNCSRRSTLRKFTVRAVKDEVIINNSVKDTAMKPQQNPVAKFQESVSSLPLLIFKTGKYSGTSFAVGLCIVATMLIIVVKGYAARKSRYNRPGSVADLVRRGQLRSDRRGISTPLKYEDPFNNPMVKVSKSNSSVEMCGKVYRLAPVTLTEEQQSVHQKRRSRAYQWKRPTMFLKEGESVPPDVDPETVRWIPANHPFATTSSDIDEDLAQNNVYQKHGVPFRIQAEHDALQRKLEALQNEQKLNKLVIDPAAARDFERPLKSHLKSGDQVEQSISNPKLSPNPPKSDRAHNSCEQNNL